MLNRGLAIVVSLASTTLAFATGFSGAQAKGVLEALRTAKEPLTRELPVEALNGLKSYGNGFALAAVTGSEDQRLGDIKIFLVKVGDERWGTLGAPVNISDK